MNVTSEINLEGENKPPFLKLSVRMLQKSKQDSQDMPYQNKM